MSSWFVYLIRCQNNSLYTGITTDLQRRLNEHERNSKDGAKYLRGKGPLKLVWNKSVPDRSAASRLEYRVKQLSKEAKEQLVLSGHVPGLTD